MLVVFAVVGLVVVFVIAAVAIGRESQRLSAQAPRPVFDLGEAVLWIGERLPTDVSAVLSYADVERILRWHLEQLQHVGAGGADSHDDSSVPSPFSVMGEDEALQGVLERASGEGVHYTSPQVRAVLEAGLTYLQLIGAVGSAEPLIWPEDSGTRPSQGDTMAVPEKGGGPAEQTL